MSASQQLQPHLRDNRRLCFVLMNLAEKLGAKAAAVQRVNVCGPT